MKENQLADNSANKVSYFATFAARIIGRGHIGKRNGGKNVRKREGIAGKGERDRTKRHDTSNERPGEKDRKRLGKRGGWGDTVNRWEAINFGLECPIAPHFVQCKFTPDVAHLTGPASTSFSLKTTRIPGVSCPSLLSTLCPRLV